MHSVALLPSIATLVGTYAGIVWATVPPFAPLLLATIWLVAAGAWMRGAARTTLVTTTAGYVLAGTILGAVAAREALTPSIRSLLDDAFGGFAIDSPGPPGIHSPILTRLRLAEDGAVYHDSVALRAEVTAIVLDGRWRDVQGGVQLTVSGASASARAADWRAGRVIEAPVTFRRPARYLNEGVPDFERDRALRGTALTGGIKSALLVEVIAPGGFFHEGTADLRARVRAAVERRVATRDRIAAAIITAILIGDRTALPDEVRERLQAAGTYHVIAISGGNIAILAALVGGALFVVGAGGRVTALAVIAVLAAYAAAITAGPSVWRATLMAIVYLTARLLDHRSPAWNTMAAAAALVVIVDPLDVRDIGFAFTFVATAAIVEAGRRARFERGSASWAGATLLASVATEVALLPMGAAAFSRVTAAGLLLNLVAVPLMTLTQIAGMLLVLLDGVESVASVAAAAARSAARALVESARLVDLLPWLAMRVPPPPGALVIAYYGALGAALWCHRLRTPALVVLAASGASILFGVAASLDARPPSGVRLTMFDVGQGDALLLETPGGRAFMIDAGGAGPDGSSFDIGGRVLAPALWARGVLRLDALAITHADFDHMSGAFALLRDFNPVELWQGVPMPRHPPSQALIRATAAAGASVRGRHAGWQHERDGVAITILHPPAPDWDRVRVRNDDSLVIDVRYGGVAILLTGDISGEVERSLIPLLRPAAVRVLKVSHHGSRGSTSERFLEAWRPHVALISCGRGNRFGHPAPEVLGRLDAVGARVFRTDRHGQLTVDTDGHDVAIRTFNQPGAIWRREGTKVTKAPNPKAPHARGSERSGDGAVGERHVPR